MSQVSAFLDTRTTLMIKHIPNKYTQSMFLAEISTSTSKKIDFFYLPIDFKNKCNRGYAFVNFLSPMFIPEFVLKYNSKKWSSFNSDKLCSITYARIQGRGAMVKRFENSSLMEKEEEFRPVVFDWSAEEVGENPAAEASETIEATAAASSTAAVAEAAAATTGDEKTTPQKGDGGD